MDRKTRKNLKSDKFALEVKHGFDFLTDHREQAIRYGAIGAAVIVIAAAVFFYMRYQSNARAEALVQAIRIDDAAVGSAPPPNLSFATAQEKEKART